MFECLLSVKCRSVSIAWCIGKGTIIRCCSVCHQNSIAPKVQNESTGKSHCLVFYAFSDKPACEHQSLIHFWHSYCLVFICGFSFLPFKVLAVRDGVGNICFCKHSALWPVTRHSAKECTGGCFATERNKPLLTCVWVPAVDRVAVGVYH